MKEVKCWDIPEEISGSYVNACVDAIDDDNFSNFKKDERYRFILEGGSRETFDYFLDKIDESPNKNLFYDNLESFRENDLYGNPDLYDSDKIGKFSLTTLKYVYNALEIYDFTKDHQVNRIVEIGGGYGGLTIALSNIFNFEEYVLVDIPEVCKLIDKYVSNFSDLKNKIKTISYLDLDTHNFEDTDLTIAINSLSECNLEQQLIYFNSIISKSKYSYIIRNLFSQKCIDEHQKTIDSLPDNFLYDDTNRVEENYSQNVIVYIKQED